MKQSLDLTNVIGGMISATSVFNLAVHLFGFGLSSTVHLLLKTYTEIFHDTILRALLFWVPFQVPSAVKDLIVFYLVGATILFRAVLTTERLRKSSDFVETAQNKFGVGVRRMKPSFSLMRFILFWPYSIATHWHATIEETIEVTGSLSRGYIYRFRGFVKMQVLIVVGALLLIILFNAGVAIPESGQKATTTTK